MSSVVFCCRLHANGDLTDVFTTTLSFEFGPDVYESFRNDKLGFFEQLDTMEPGEQSRSLRMIQAFIDLQEETGGNIDFKACVRIAFNRMMKGECNSICHLENKICLLPVPSPCLISFTNRLSHLYTRPVPLGG